MNFKVVLAIMAFTIVSCSQKGKQFPLWDIQTIDGKHISKSELEKKILVINVWATWCGTCIEEIPQLNKLVSKYKNNDEILFLALSDETPSKVHNSLKRFPFSFTQVADAEQYTNQIQSRLVKTYPQTLVVDQNNTIVFDVSDEPTNIFNRVDQVIQELK